MLEMGTILKVSPAGYVQVAWDKGGVGYFSPAGAFRLNILAGRDALKRHWWTSEGTYLRSVDVVCRRCGAEQTDENEFEPCKG